MALSRFLLVSVLIFLPACQETMPSSHELDPARRDSLAGEVRGVMGSLTSAMNRGDPDEVLGFYADTDEFVYLGCTDLMFGSAFFKAVVHPYYLQNPDPGFVREILRVQILSPQSAVVTLQGRSDSAPALFWTQVLTRTEDGRWLITHEHESWPGCDEPPSLHPTGMPSDTGGISGLEGGR